MAWQAMAGPSPVQSDAGQVVTTCRIQNTALGVGQFTVDVPNDGTVAGLTAAVRSLIAARDGGSGKRNVVPSGTVLDLSDPPPPPGPTQAETDQATWIAAYQKVVRIQRGHAAGVSAITAQQLSDAQSALNALPYLASYEGLL